MIQMQTSLEVADNSGARRVEMIMPIGGSTGKIASLGDRIKVTVKEASPDGTIKKGTVQDAVILVEGRRFEVTSNLLSALRSIRKRKAKTLIWIDQICINQEDFEERGHQVSIMKHIYSRARTVVVCYMVYVSEAPLLTDFVGLAWRIRPQRQAVRVCTKDEAK